MLLSFVMGAVMRKSVTLTIITILALLITSGMACGNRTPVETIMTYLEAMESKNINTMVSLESEHMWDTSNGQPIEREQRKEQLESQFGKPSWDQIHSNVEIELISQSDITAVVQASYTAQSYQNGMEFGPAFDSHEQYTLIMNNGKWLISERDISP
jgi:hypothetical protein